MYPGALGSSSAMSWKQIPGLFKSNLEKLENLSMTDVFPHVPYKCALSLHKGRGLGSLEGDQE
jgi:hypothetical protein